MRILESKVFRNLPAVRGAAKPSPEPLIVCHDQLLAAALDMLATRATNVIVLTQQSAPVNGRLAPREPPSFVPGPESALDAHNNRTRLALLQDLDEPEPPLEKFPGTGRKLGRKAQKVKMPTVDAYGKLCRQ